MQDNNETATSHERDDHGDQVSAAEAKNTTADGGASSIPPFTAEQQQRYDAVMDAIKTAGYELNQLNCEGGSIGTFFAHAATDKTFWRLCDGRQVREAAMEVVMGQMPLDIFLQQMEAARMAAPERVPDPLASDLTGERIDLFSKMLTAAGYEVAPPGRAGDYRLFKAGETVTLDIPDRDEAVTLPVPACGMLHHADVIAFVNGDDSALATAIAKVKRNDRLSALSSAFARANCRCEFHGAGFTVWKDKTGVHLSAEDFFDYAETGTPTLEQLVDDATSKFKSGPF